MRSYVKILDQFEKTICKLKNQFEICSKKLVDSMHWHVEKLVNEFIEPLSNDLLSTSATNFGSQGWSLFTSLTVLVDYTKRKM